VRHTIFVEVARDDGVVQRRSATNVIDTTTRTDAIGIVICAVVGDRAVDARHRAAVENTATAGGALAATDCESNDARSLAGVYIEHTNEVAATDSDALTAVVLDGRVLINHQRRERRDRVR